MIAALRSSALRTHALPARPLVQLSARSTHHYTLHSADGVFVKEEPHKKMDISFYYPSETAQAQTKDQIQSEFWKDLSEAKKELAQGKVSQSRSAINEAAAPETIAEGHKHHHEVAHHEHHEEGPTKIPGFRELGTVPSNWEVATGIERYEFLKLLAGEDPWEDTRPIVLETRPTVENPAVVLGVDPERYIGCTGWPVGSHEINWLTLRPQKDGTLDRCPKCGNAFKYIRKSSYLGVHADHHH